MIHYFQSISKFKLIKTFREIKFIKKKDFIILLEVSLLKIKLKND